MVNSYLLVHCHSVLRNPGGGAGAERNATLGTFPGTRTVQRPQEQGAHSPTEDSDDAWYEPLLSSIRLGQFLVVGIVGALVDNTLLITLVELAKLEPVVAAFGAKEASILVMFVVNDRWTFAEQPAAGGWETVVRFLKSNAVRAGGAGVGIGTLYVLTHEFGLGYLVANVLGIGTGFVFNYTFESLVTWRITGTMP